MGTIAGAEVGRPERVEDITAEWLTTVFRTSGALGSDGSVAGVSIEPFAVGLGFLSELTKATLTYAGEASHAPSSVIIKMVTSLEVQRGLADALLSTSESCASIVNWPTISPSAPPRSTRRSWTTTRPTSSS